MRRIMTLPDFAIQAGLKRNAKPRIASSHARVVKDRDYSYGGGIPVPDGPETDEQRAFRLDAFERSLNPDFARKNGHRIDIYKDRSGIDSVDEVANVQRAFHYQLILYWHYIFKREVQRITGTSTRDTEYYAEITEENLYGLFEYRVLAIDKKLSQTDLQILQQLNDRPPEVQAKWAIDQWFTWGQRSGRRALLVEGEEFQALTARLKNENWKSYVMM